MERLGVEAPEIRLAEQLDDLDGLIIPGGESTTIVQLIDIFKLRDVLSAIEAAALVGCGVVTGVGAVTNTARVRAGDIVAVVGLGGVGLNAILGAKLGGAEKIIAIDIADSRLGLARQLGATHTFNAKNADCIGEVLKLTEGGVDFAVETAGVIAAMETCYNILRAGGQVIACGIPPSTDTFEFRPAQLVGEERGILGSSSCFTAR